MLRNRQPKSNFEIPGYDDGRRVAKMAIIYEKLLSLDEDTMSLLRDFAVVYPLAPGQEQQMKTNERYSGYHVMQGTWWDGDQSIYDGKSHMDWITQLPPRLNSQKLFIKELTPGISLQNQRVLLADGRVALEAPKTANIDGTDTYDISKGINGNPWLTEENGAHITLPGSELLDYGMIWGQGGVMRLEHIPMTQVHDVANDLEALQTV